MGWGGGGGGGGGATKQGEIQGMIDPMGFTHIDYPKGFITFTHIHCHSNGIQCTISNQAISSPTYSTDNRGEGT